MENVKVGLIFLSGGKGLRLGSETPKQFLPLGNKPIFRHSLDLLLAMQEIAEHVIVACPEYHHLFPKHLLFANPGKTRQESAFNGQKLLSNEISHLLIHDAARPFITKDELLSLLKIGIDIGAAALGHPMTSTIKKACTQNNVEETLEREAIWEVFTPQVIKRSLFVEGYESNQQVTDDIAFAELLNHPAKLVKGSRLNIKITTLDDLKLAQTLCQNTN